MKYVTTVNEQEITIEIVDEYNILVNGKPYNVDFISVGGGLIYSLILEGKSYEVHVSPAEEGVQVIVQGVQYRVDVEDERERRLRAASGQQAMEHGEVQLKAPMPGLVVSIPAEEGQEVEKGSVLLILESMKMQNELKSPRAGKVSRIRVKPGDSVEQKQVLLTLT